MTGPGSVMPDDAVLDAHVHFWDPARFDYPWLSSVPALNRAFLPEHLRRDAPAGTPVVFVQADCRPEQSAAEIGWVRELRAAGAPVVAAVAHAPLEDGPGVAPRLAELAADPLVSGVRRLLQDEGDGFALRDGFTTGTELLAGTGMPLDVCIRRHQLPEATELARRRPDLTVVLDHLGKPEVSPQAFRSWAQDLGRLAALPHAVCKLSGLATEAAPGRRTAAHLLPFLREAIDLFGPDRCLFGSDWPVLTTAMAYRQWLELVREAIGDLTDDQRAHVLHGTAGAVYGVEPGPLTGQAGKARG